MTISTFVLVVIALISGKLELPTTLVSIPLAPMLAMGALGVFNTAPARQRGGRDLRQPQQLDRAPDWRHCGSGRAR
jgi:hypothetical protein